MHKIGLLWTDISLESREAERGCHPPRVTRPLDGDRWDGYTKRRCKGLKEFLVGKRDKQCYLCGQRGSGEQMKNQLFALW